MRPGLPAAVFEARMRENAREGQKLKSKHFAGRGTRAARLLFGFENEKMRTTGTGCTPCRPGELPTAFLPEAVHSLK